MGDLLIEARDHCRLSADRAAVELEGLFAAALEIHVGLDSHAERLAPRRSACFVQKRQLPLRAGDPGRRLACALVVLLYSVRMLSSTFPALSLEYAFVLLCVGGCLAPPRRLRVRCAALA
jgi:hypothetical protein